MLLTILAALYMSFILCHCYFYYFVDICCFIFLIFACAFHQYCCLIQGGLTLISNGPHAVVSTISPADLHDKARNSEHTAQFSSVITSVEFAAKLKVGYFCRHKTHISRRLALSVNLFSSPCVCIIHANERSLDCVSIFHVNVRPL